MRKDRLNLQDLPPVADIPVLNFEWERKKKRTKIKISGNRAGLALMAELFARVAAGEGKGRGRGVPNVQVIVELEREPVAGNEETR